MSVRNSPILAGFLLLKINIQESDFFTKLVLISLTQVWILAWRLGFQMLVVGLFRPLTSWWNPISWPYHLVNNPLQLYCPCWMMTSLKFVDVSWYLFHLYPGEAAEKAYSRRPAPGRPWWLLYRTMTQVTYHLYLRIFKLKKTKNVVKKNYFTDGVCVPLHKDDKKNRKINFRGCWAVICWNMYQHWFTTSIVWGYSCVLMLQGIILVWLTCMGRSFLLCN